jgi:regulator of sigma D
MFNSRRSSFISKKVEPAKRKQLAFDDDQVVQALNENDFQSWCETCIQYISAIYRTIKKYISIVKDKQGQDYQIVDNIWQPYHEILCTLIRHDTEQEDMAFNKTVSIIIMQIYKSIEDFLTVDDLECQRFTVERIEFMLSLITQTQNWVLNEITNFDIMS